MRASMGNMLNDISLTVRYATNGKHTLQQIQPIIARDRGNIAIAHVSADPKSLVARIGHWSF
jgi:glutamine phosphoribosylpyrophosphate amidotransferase